MPCRIGRPVMTAIPWFALPVRSGLGSSASVRTAAALMSINITVATISDQQLIGEGTTSRWLFLRE